MMPWGVLGTRFSETSGGNPLAPKQKHKRVVRTDSEYDVYVVPISCTSSIYRLSLPIPVLPPDPFTPSLTCTRESSMHLDLVILEEVADDIVITSENLPAPKQKHKRVVRTG